MRSDWDCLFLLYKDFYFCNQALLYVIMATMDDQYYVKLTNALSLQPLHEDFITNDKLLQLLKDISDGASCYIDMILWPLLTAASSLMGISTAKTHRNDIFFAEPNVLWTCVAAEPGMFTAGLIRYEK